ncbi:putative 2OG-Fe(II) oxygenase [Planctomicrobium sp. SH668]|uniref:putative 2OG-Fe(II) oxygenase n=1 Tax=Planctomicrobium sp. SH668 TaxID=3448126 RepID=UPI003F5B8EE7
MQVSEYTFFPTRVVTIQFPETESLNADLCKLFDERPDLDDRFNLLPEAQNLVRLAETVPAIAQLRSMFISGAKRWLQAEGMTLPEGIDVVLFSNRMQRGDATIVHNHLADLIGIYYARTAEASRDPIDLSGSDDYFDAGDGLLVLHDPRFNANLTTVCNRDHVKVTPRPGFMLIFPAYVWHSVTPHRGDFHRLAFSMNFTMRWPSGESEYVSLNDESSTK